MSPYVPHLLACSNYLLNSLPPPTQSRAGCEALAASLASHEPKLHILINNSGATWGAPMRSFPEREGWDRVMNLNVRGPFFLTAALVPMLEKDSTSERPGRVVNVSSVASLEANVEDTALAAKGDGLYSYHVSKACVPLFPLLPAPRSPPRLHSAVNHLTSIQATSLARKHVTVNAILPGVFPSNMTAYGIQTSGDEIAQSQPSGAFTCSLLLSSLFCLPLFCLPFLSPLPPLSPPLSSLKADHGSSTHKQADSEKQKTWQA